MTVKQFQAIMREISNEMTVPMATQVQIYHQSRRNHGTNTTLECREADHKNLASNATFVVLQVVEINEVDVLKARGEYFFRDQCFSSARMINETSPAIIIHHRATVKK